MSIDASHPGDGFGPVVYRTEHDDADDLSTSVLMALDSLPDFDAEVSGDVLFSRIDPDALDALFRANSTALRASGQVTFPIDRYHVTVSATGDIVVRERRS
jgi:hypothetical protein